LCWRSILFSHPVRCGGVGFALTGVHAFACYRTVPGFLALYVTRFPSLIGVPIFCHFRYLWKCVALPDCSVALGDAIWKPCVFSL